MAELWNNTLLFFIENTPDWKTILLVGPPAFLWALACLSFAGNLKMRCGVPTGYTRKVFHFLIFGSAAAIQTFAGTSILCLFGGMTSLCVFLAIYLGPGNRLYEAMAREKDAPKQTHYILTPYLATLAGGLSTNILFGPVAIVGYLVTGIADAVAEPVGTRFGKHPYRTPSLTSVPSTRTLEGSAAVFIGSILALMASDLLLPEFVWPLTPLLLFPLLALVFTIIEAFSPHGWDNFTLQLLPTSLVVLIT